MDYCNKDYQIGTYAPVTSSSGGSYPNEFTSVDCVSLEANSITCDTLTIDGEVWNTTETDSIGQKTVNQSATLDPSVTTFIGTLYADEIDVGTGEISSYTVYADTLTPSSSTTLNVNAPLGVYDTITCTNSVTIANLNSTGSNVLAVFVQPLLPATNSLKVRFGKSSSVTDECAELSFTHTSTPSSTNYMSLHLLNRQNTSAVRVYPTYTDVIGELRVNNYPVISRIMSNYTTLSGAMSPTLQSSIPTNATRIVICITNCKKDNLGPIAVTPLTSGTPTSLTVEGMVWGNNGSSIYNWTNTTTPRTSMFLWNAASLPADETNKPRYYSYTIVLTYMGSVGGYETYTIDGHGSESQSQYYISMSGRMTASATGQKITSIQLNRNDTGSFTSGYASVQYY